MKKSYVVRYYIDYKNHGIDVIFNDKEVAEKHAKMMTEQDEDINCHYRVYEEIVYNPFDERRSIGIMHDRKLEDLVNHPSHYNQGGIETLDIIKMSLTKEEYKGYLKGNVLKYRERAQFKGNAEQDYAKAKFYFDELEEH